MVAPEGRVTEQRWPAAAGQGVGPQRLARAASGRRQLLLRGAPGRAPLSAEQGLGSSAAFSQLVLSLLSEMRCH